MCGRVRTSTVAPVADCRPGVGPCSRALLVGCKGEGAAGRTAGLKQENTTLVFNRRN